MKVALIAPQRRVEDSYRRSSEYLFRKSGANTGNFAFVEALSSHLSPHVEIFPWEASPDVLRERCDIIVMACANQLGPHSNLEQLAIMFERAKLPILAIGLGAQAKELGATVELTPGTRRWLDVVAAHAPSKAPNIGVRGEFSREQVERNSVHDRAIVTGCPSNFINPDPSLAAALEERYRRARRCSRGPASLGETRSARACACGYRGINLGRLHRAIRNRHDPHGASRVGRDGPGDVPEHPRLHSARSVGRCVPPLVQAVCDMLRRCNIVDGIDEELRLRRRAAFPRHYAGDAGRDAGGVIAHDSRTLEMCDTMRFRSACTTICRPNSCHLICPRCSNSGRPLTAVDDRSWRDGMRTC